MNGRGKNKAKKNIEEAPANAQFQRVQMIFVIRLLALADHRVS
jgi:hypothetical protein